MIVSLVLGKARQAIQKRGVFLAYGLCSHLCLEYHSIDDIALAGISACTPPGTLPIVAKTMVRKSLRVVCRIVSLPQENSGYCVENGLIGPVCFSGDEEGVFYSSVSLRIVESKFCVYTQAPKYSVDTFSNRKIEKKNL